MSDKDFPPDKGAFSLRKEVHKRQTQAMQRALEEKRASKTDNTSFADKPLPTPAWKRASQEIPAPPSTVPADPRRTQTVRTTQTARATQPVTAPKRTTQLIPAAAVTHPRFMFGPGLRFWSAQEHCLLLPTHNQLPRRRRFRSRWSGPAT
jgi:hypothetical protein